MWYCNNPHHNCVLSHISSMVVLKVALLGWNGEWTVPGRDRLLLRSAPLCLAPMWISDWYNDVDAMGRRDDETISQSKGRNVRCCFHVTSFQSFDTRIRHTVTPRRDKLRSFECDRCDATFDKKDSFVAGGEVHSRRRVLKGWGDENSLRAGPVSWGLIRGHEDFCKLPN